MPTTTPATSAPADPQPCRAEDLTVDVAVSPTQVQAGERVTLRVRVSAVALPCRLDVGPVARAAEVRSGGAPVWSTEHCEAGDDSAPLVLRPGSPHEFTVRWEGRRTAPGCPGGLGGPSAGEHVAVVQVGPARSGDVPFRLT
ncbi:MAG: hypothetical protein M3P95_07940 [Actinomycetota bacterium]|nr:hypothetical protein [Actinomycetota bacterium]